MSEKVGEGREGRKLQEKVGKCMKKYENAGKCLKQIEKVGKLEKVGENSMKMYYKG
jgi:hypothetical protein